MAPDWEPSATGARAQRARAGRTIPVNDADSPIAPRCSTPSAAARSSTRALPALPPVGLPRADARRRRRRLADRLRAARAVLRRQRAHDGRVGARRRSRLSAEEVPLPPVPLGKLGETLARGFNRLGWHWWPSDSAIATREYEGRARLHQRGHVPHRLPAGREGQHRHHLLAAAIRRGVTLKTRCRVREITVGDGRHGGRRHLLRRATASSGGRRREVVSSRATASARRACSSTRARGTSPTGSPTAAASSART